MNIMSDTNENLEELKEDNIVDTTKIISAKMLRRDYVYDARQLYMNTHNRRPTMEELEVFKIQSKELYPREGMYSVNGDVVTFLKEY